MRTIHVPIAINSKHEKKTKLWTKVHVHVYAQYVMSLVFVILSFYY